MKQQILIAVAALAMVLTWPSCNQVEEQGSISFGLELSEDAALKSTSANYRIDAALVTIKDRNGALIYDKEYLPVYKFGDQFTTKSLKIPVGKFQLCEFMLVDSMGVVLWATPVEGSNLAHMVRKPLPLEFDVVADQTTSLPIQVIRVADFRPGDFGYLNFDIDFVDRFCLQVLYSTRCVEEWPEGLMAPQHQPRLTIVAGDRILVEEALNPGLNHYRIPMVDTVYLISATDCHGNVIYRERFQVMDLLKHRCADHLKPLLINWGQSDVTVTPEGLTEPTIKQGIYGRITVPVDDTTGFESYDVRPVVRDVYLFPWAVMDSIYTFAPINCYIHPDMIGMDPLAIVRSNSDGFFEAPLRQGEYLYVVKVGEQYFIPDLQLSSRRGGYVMVYPEEITKLLIHILDCSMWM